MSIFAHCERVKRNVRCTSSLSGGTGGRHISTREGITPVKEDDLIMRGVQGEEYPIGRELWEQTYRVHSITGKDNAS